MPKYLVESYAPQAGAVLEEAVARMRLAANEIAAEGIRIRHVRSTFVPQDETCFHVFEAQSAAVIDEVGRRAGLPFQHIVEAMSIAPGGGRSASREEES